ncbi:hypothetical protein OROMI_001592 [Orobanche minor]
MELKGFFPPQILSSSRIRYESLFLPKRHFLSLSASRCLGTKSIANGEKMNLGLGNINGSDDALFLYEKLSRTRPLPNVVQFNKLLSRLVNLKEYAAAIFLFKDIYNLGVSVDDYTMNIAINSYCLSDRVDCGFSVLGWFFKRGFIPDVFTFSTLLKGLFRGNMINEA